MIFELVAAIALQGAVPNNWEMGGGRTWINPPSTECRQADARCLLEELREQERARFGQTQALAKKGDVKAMRITGLMLLNGAGVRKDASAAVGWFYEAAIRGDRPSMRALGKAFEQGLGVDPDPTLARLWLERAER